MATSKLLKPTNVTISIPEFTDQPDQRVNSNCIDKEADAINSLSEHIGTLSNLTTTAKTNVVSAINEVNSYALNVATGFKYYTITAGDSITLNGSCGLAVFNAYGVNIVAIKNDGTKSVIYEQASGGANYLVVSKSGNVFTFKNNLSWRMSLNIIWCPVV